MDLRFWIGTAGVFLGGVAALITAAYSDLIDHYRSGDPRREEHATTWARSKGLDPKSFAWRRLRWGLAATFFYSAAVISMVWGW